MVAAAILLSSLGFAVSALAYTTNFDVFSDTSCQNYITTVETDETDGSCNELNGFQSVNTQSVNAGCGLTVYTDSSCSDNAIVAGAGACVASSDGFYSYTVDC